MADSNVFDLSSTLNKIDSANKLKKGEADLTQINQTCDIHGGYLAKWNYFEAMDRRVLTGCPNCESERLADEAADFEREKANQKQAAFEKALGRSGVPLRFRDRTFQNYQADDFMRQKALSILERYALNFEDVSKTGRSLILSGKTGTGKTHLATALANHLLKLGKTPLYITLYDLISSIKQTWGYGSNKSESQVIAAYAQCDLLIIDEIGAQFKSDAEKLILFDIINKRYERLQPTIIISNYPLDSAKGQSIKKAVGDRVIDRLREGGGCLVGFDWDSYRKKTTNEKG